MATRTQDGPNLRQRLRAAVERGGVTLRKPQAPQGAAREQKEQLERLGLLAINAKSSAPDVEDFTDRLWHDQDDALEPMQREVLQSLLYCAGEQLLAYHRERRLFIPRKVLPWKVRSTYNVIQKAVNLRVSRLVENKPAVSVQAKSADASDVEKAEYKETLFWYLWDRLALHMKIAAARRWAAKGGSGFLKVGADPEAGVPYPRTLKRPRYIEQPDPMTGAPVQTFDGIEEIYLDADGNELGPVEVAEADLFTGEPRYEKAPIPEDVDWITDGEATVSVRSPLNVRWDLYTDDIADSWYIQDGEILPLSKILAMHPDAEDAIREARPASDDEKALRWTGQATRIGSAELPNASIRAKNAQPDQAKGVLDEEYFYLETWIFPKNQLLKKLWGAKGARIVTVGGAEVARTELPAWALKACPFVQFIDTIEEGNHYGRPFTRDLIPLQDDINRARSQRAERIALLSRMILWAPANHGINVRALGDMSAALITTRTRDHKPEALNLATGDPGIREFELDTLQAAADVGNMNDASTGKLPSAGLAAKALYALQYADERSVAETSTLQDVALKRLAEALDAVVRETYTEPRKIRLVGEDRAFMVEHELSPETACADVDYTFTPGSMMSRQKEAVKNELFQLLETGLVDPATVRKHLATAVPDVFRTSYNLQEAKARRQLQRILRASVPPAIAPAPFDDPMVHTAVIEEFALTAKWDLIGPSKQGQVMQLWQAYKLMADAAAQAAMPPQGDPAAGGGTAAGPPAPAPGGIPGNGAAAPADGAAQLEQEATAAMEAEEPPGLEAFG